MLVRYLRQTICNKNLCQSPCAKGKLQCKKSKTNFSNLQAELSETEDKISYSRQFYNDSVTRYNTKLELFPSNIIASMFHFTPENLFEVDNSEARKNVKVDFNK